MLHVLHNYAIHASIYFTANITGDIASHKLYLSVISTYMYRANMYRYTFFPGPSRAKRYRGTECIAN